MKFAHWLLLGSMCAVPLLAGAQWQWTDKDGKKVFSDQAPPPDIPERNIVRRPGAPGPRSNFSPAGSVPQAGAVAVAPAASAASGLRPSGVDKDLEEKTRKAEEAEKAKQAAEAQKVAKAKADNCTRARQGKATFDSGIRVARLNAQGEREIMDDKARATEQQRLQSVIDNDCK